MAQTWFVRGGGKVYGPLDAPKLKQLVADGKMNEATEVAQNHSGPWYPAGRVKGLFAQPAAPTTLNAPPPPQALAPQPAQPKTDSHLRVPARIQPTVYRRAASYFPRSVNGKIAAAAGLCSLLSLVVGYFAGREHLRYQIRSSFQNAGKRFVEEIKEGMGQALGNAINPVEKEPPKPKAQLKIGQPIDSAESSFVVTSARMEFPVLKGGIRGTASKHDEECLVVGLTIRNKDSRKQLKVSYGQPFGKNVFTMQDDVGNDVDTMFFSSPSTDYTIAGSHPQYKEIDPEQSVEHFVAFKRPLPKTKSLTLLIDMDLIGQDGIVQYDIPIEAVEGFAGN
jgi:hypothetical protein